MSRSEFVTLYVDPNDMHFRISKGIVISTRQVGSKKTAEAEVVYYLEKYTQDRMWIPVSMSTGDSKLLVQHLTQVYKAATPKSDSTSIVDQINGSINELEEKVKEIIGDLDQVHQETEGEVPEWKDQYEDLKKQIAELKKDAKDLKNITPETVHDYDGKVESEDKTKSHKPKSK